MFWFWKCSPIECLCEFWLGRILHILERLSVFLYVAISSSDGMNQDITRPSGLEIAQIDEEMLCQEMECRPTLLVAIHLSCTSRTTCSFAHIDFLVSFYSSLETGR
nr:hypothetical protein CFP56_63945 [Quercus suber]